MLEYVVYKLQFFSDKRLTKGYITFENFFDVEVILFVRVVMPKNSNVIVLSYSLRAISVDQPPNCFVIKVTFYFLILIS